MKFYELYFDDESSMKTLLKINVYLKCNLKWNVDHNFEVYKGVYVNAMMIYFTALKSGKKLGGWCRMHSFTIEYIDFILSLWPYLSNLVERFLKSLLIVMKNIEFTKIKIFGLNTRPFIVVLKQY